MSHNVDYGKVLEVMEYRKSARRAEGRGAEGPRGGLKLYINPLPITPHTFEISDNLVD